MWLVIYKKDTKRIVRLVEYTNGIRFGHSDDCLHAIVRNKPEGKYFEE